MKIGTLIRRTREEQSLSLDVLAGKVKVSASTLSRIENHDQSRVPSAELLGRLAKALDLSPDEVFPAAGRLPPDVTAWLLTTPGALGAVRQKMKRAA